LPDLSEVCSPTLVCITFAAFELQIISHDRVSQESASRRSPDNRAAQSKKNRAALKRRKKNRAARSQKLAEDSAQLDVTIQELVDSEVCSPTLVLVTFAASESQRILHDRVSQESASRRSTEELTRSGAKRTGLRPG
jgi:hypothetical protein